MVRPGYPMEPGEPHGRGGVDESAADQRACGELIGRRVGADEGGLVLRHDRLLFRDGRAVPVSVRRGLIGQVPRDRRGVFERQDGAVARDAARQVARGCRVPARSMNRV
jgi:hypothetical protein